MGSSNPARFGEPLHMSPNLNQCSSSLSIAVAATSGAFLRACVCPKCDCVYPVCPDGGMESTMPHRSTRTNEDNYRPTDLLTHSLIPLSYSVG